MSIISENKSTLETIDLLQCRLQRIEYYLTGSDDGHQQLRSAAAKGRDHGIQARIAQIEDKLNRIASKSPLAHDLLSLYSTYPDLFPASNLEDVPTTLTTPELLAIIESCATSFHTTASQLSSISDLPIPSTETFASLIALKPRIARMELLQESQGKEVAELRARSAIAVQKWYELGVLGASECWTEWEQRLSNVEKRIRRKEGQNAREVEESKAYNR